MGLNGLRILTLESRRSNLVQNLIEEQGGECFNAPSVRERPLDANPQAIQFAKDLILECVEDIVLRQHGLRRFGVTRHEGVERVVQHPLGHLRHSREVDQRLDVVAAHHRAEQLGREQAAEVVVVVEAVTPATLAASVPAAGVGAANKYAEAGFPPRVSASTDLSA